MGGPAGKRSEWSACVAGWSDRLGVRLALVLAVALLPLMAALMLQTREAVLESEAHAEAALMGETLLSLRPIVREIQRARAQVLLTASALPSSFGDLASCQVMARRLHDGIEHASAAMFIPLDGKMVCSADGSSHDFNGSDLLRTLIAGGAETLIPNGRDPISGEAVLSISREVRDEASQRVGFLVASLPHRLLLSLGSTADVSGKTADLAVFQGGDGAILGATRRLEDMQSLLPAHFDLAGITGPEAESFSAIGHDGEARAYAVVDLVPDLIYAIGAVPLRSLTGPDFTGRILPIIAVLLTWGASVLIAYWAMQRMVIRHLRRLSRALSYFAADGRVMDTADFASAPAEMRDLVDSYAHMTETILKDEAELQGMLRQKEVLLREVHHRVKNNLQMISSIISMQMRATSSTEVRGLLRGLQDRVLGLATVHRGLYMAHDSDGIAARGLMADIVRQLSRKDGGAERDDGIVMVVDDLTLTPDQAMPFSLLFTEALANAIAYAARDAGRPDITVSLHATENRMAVLEVRNRRANAAPAASGDNISHGLGLRLIAAFGHQLGGEAVIRSEPEEYIISIRFELRPFDEGSDRFAA